MIARYLGGSGEWRGSLSKLLTKSLVAQSLASLTSVALVISVSRASGASGLGTIAIGLNAFTLCVVVVRSAVAHPFLVYLGSVGNDERQKGARAAASLSVAAGASGAALFAVGSLVFPDPLGDALAVLWPALAPAVIYDTCRAVGFGTERSRLILVGDAIWLAFTAALPLAGIASPVDAWILGVTTSCVLTMAALRLTLAAPSAALSWGRQVGGRVAKWLTMDTVIFQGSVTLTTIAVAALTNESTVGRLRAVESLLTPVSLIGPALLLAVLPRFAAETSREEVTRLVRHLLAALSALATIYTLCAVGSAPLVERLLGPDFHDLRPLAAALGVGQVFLAASLGAAAYLIAADARLWFIAKATGHLFTAAAVSVAAIFGGIDAIATATMLGSAAAAIIIGRSFRMAQRSMP